MSLRPYICRNFTRRLTISQTQKRSYGERWIQNKIGADWEWKDKAGLIAKGELKSMSQTLEERGFLHQIAGFVFSFRGLPPNGC